MTDRTHDPGPHTQGARFVSFRGPVGELPQGGDGSYGTSISLYKAVEDINDVIIAYKQNGRRAPDGKGSKSDAMKSLHFASQNQALCLANPCHAVCRLLTPDHGFPVRLIIPGHIGGRMIKWLEVRHRVLSVCAHFCPI